MQKATHMSIISVPSAYLEIVEQHCGKCRKSLNLPRKTQIHIRFGLQMNSDISILVTQIFLL